MTVSKAEYGDPTPRPDDVDEQQARQHELDGFDPSTKSQFGVNKVMPFMMRETVRQWMFPKS